MSDQLQESTMAENTAVSPKGHRKVMAAFIIATLGIVIILGRALTMNPSQIPSVLIGKPAQAIDVEVVQGREFLRDPSAARVHLEELKGKPLILNFWASWCVACRDEAAEMEAFWQESKGNGVQVLGVAIQDEVGAAQQFAKTYGKTYALGLDDTGQTAINYGVTGVPETFIIDADGVIRDKIVGPATIAQLREKIQALTKNQ